MRYVQALPYEPDGAGSVDLVTVDLDDALRKGGDCEERACLVAAFCDANGVRAMLEWMAQDGAPLDHVTSLVWLGRWVWADATVPGAELGEDPRAAARRLHYGSRVGADDATSMGTTYGAPTPPERWT